MPLHDTASMMPTEVATSVPRAPAVDRATHCGQGPLWPAIVAPIERPWPQCSAAFPSRAGGAAAAPPSSLFSCHSCRHSCTAPLAPHASDSDSTADGPTDCRCGCAATALPLLQRAASVPHPLRWSLVSRFGSTTGQARCAPWSHATHTCARRRCTGSGTIAGRTNRRINSAGGTACDSCLLLLRPPPTTAGLITHGPRLSPSPLRCCAGPSPRPRRCRLT